MSEKKREKTVDPSPTAEREAAVDKDSQPSTDSDTKPVEIGGRDGPDPVRYGDWEKGGRCIDF